MSESPNIGFPWRLWTEICIKEKTYNETIITRRNSTFLHKCQVSKDFCHTPLYASKRTPRKN